MSQLLLKPNKPKAEAASRRHRKRRLAIRAMAAQTAWLEGRLRWHNGRVAWEDGQRLFMPSPADLALTRRRLGQIGGSPLAARLTLGDDLLQWLDRRFALLELAKQLQPLFAPDLLTLAQQSPYHYSFAIIQRLVKLLVPEALCLGPLPASPATALLHCGERAAGLLRELVELETAPLAGRALAALVLGAIQGRTAGWPPELAGLGRGDNWLRRAYNWGLQHGFPAEAALVVALLEGAEGVQLARRGLSALNNDANPFRLPAEWLRERLAGGINRHHLLELMEATADGKALAERILDCHDVGLNPLFDKTLDLTKITRSGRLKRDKLVQLRQKVGLERQEFLTNLTKRLPAYLEACPDPAVVSHFYRFIHAILDLGSLTTDLAEAALRALDCGLELQPALQYPFLQLLAEQHARIWDVARLPAAKEGSPVFTDTWLKHFHKSKVLRVQKLLAATGKLELVCEIIEIRDGLDCLYWCNWSDLGFYRLWLDIMRSIQPYYYDDLPRNLTRALACFSTVQAARKVFKPLLAALATVKGTERGFLLELLLDDMPLTRRNLSQRLPRLARYVPVMIAYMLECPDDGWLVRRVADGLVLLDKELPSAEAQTWIEWIFKLITEMVTDSQKSAHFQSYQLSAAVTLAYHLSGGNFAAFQTCFKVAIQQELNDKLELVEAGLAALAPFPRLKAALALVFPQEFKRCGRLLILLGLATRLGQAVLAPLAALDTLEQANPVKIENFSTLGYFLDEGAMASFERWTELLPALLVYLQARQLCQLDLQLPAGVRQSLEFPARLAKEAAHLEQRVITAPRPELLTRLNNLRARLAGSASLREEVHKEVSKKLELAAAQAHLAAAEQQLTACYHARLKSLVGKLSSDVKMNDDLLNAALLTSDIDRNRRLLLRLLRAYLVEGQTGWPDHLKPNQIFLKELGEHGVKVEGWLETRPRHYSSSKISGGIVHLKLERDPLHILQMGNYFDTCLSFGNANAFSTVANACELNKRIIYATDGAGRVIGRKLIGINAEWQLVGYRTYTSLQNTEANQALNQIFRRYCVDFAAGCGLVLGEKGPVPKLLAEAWYDDGTVSWEVGQDLAKTGSAKLCAQSPRQLSNAGEPHQD